MSDVEKLISSACDELVTVQDENKELRAENERLRRLFNDLSAKSDTLKAEIEKLREELQVVTRRGKCVHGRLLGDNCSFCKAGVATRPEQKGESDE